MGPRFLDFLRQTDAAWAARLGAQLWLEPGRPWGHAGVGTGASTVLAAIIALAVVGAVLFAAQ